jgi:Cu+-exporting ATPase
MTDTALRLDLEGMTCASCAARIEKKLNKLDGVEATVNFATEQATVALTDSSLTVDDLVAAVRAAGYDAHEPVPETSGTQLSEAGRWQQLLVVGLVCGLPVVAMSMIRPLQFDWWQWVALALSIPVVTWVAWPFHRATWVNLRHRAATMDTLVSIGVLAAFGASLWALAFGGAGGRDMRMDMSLRDGLFGTSAVHSGAHSAMSTMDGMTATAAGAAPLHLYLEVAVSITVLVVLGRYLEHRAKGRAGDALRSLLQLGAKRATRLRDDNSEEEVAADQLMVGDRFLVRPGETVATDGRVLSGRSAVDASLVTGESVPVEVGPDDRVVGGTINTAGRLVVTATGVGADTQLARMARLVEEAQTGKAPVQRLADRISAVFVPIVVLLAIGTALTWWLLGHDATRAFTAAVAVLVIACPCALGLATPTALLVGTGRGAELGILIRGPEILESTRRVDTIVLDKTGTVTTGVMSVVAVNGSAADRAVVVAVEAASEHPIARAVVAHERAAGATLPSVEHFENDAGRGVRGVVNGATVVVANPERLVDLGSDVPADLGAWSDQQIAAGCTVVLGVIDGVARSGFALQDRPRSNSAAAIATLRAAGLRPILCTGDRTEVALPIAAAVGIEDVRSGVLPEDKVRVVRELQGDGAVVAMVGDGVNDAAALATADLGIAMGSGAEVAVAAADITLVRNDLAAVADALALSRRTLRTIKANLVWAFGYNIAAIPLAMTGRLNPVIAAAAMAFSSVFVVTNSLRLRRFRGA